MRPCPSIALAVLSAVDEGGAVLRCCDVEGHEGEHWFHMEWRDA